MISNEFDCKWCQMMSSPWTRHQLILHDLTCIWMRSSDSNMISNDYDRSQVKTSELDWSEMVSSDFKWVQRSSSDLSGLKFIPNISQMSSHDLHGFEWIQAIVNEISHFQMVSTNFKGWHSSDNKRAPTHSSYPTCVGFICSCILYNLCTYI